MVGSQGFWPDVELTNLSILPIGRRRFRRSIVGTLGHALAMPESARQYKRNPLTNYVSGYNKSAT